MKVAPSILSVFNQNLDEILFQLAKADIKYLHLDVMDNKFVPNYTFDETFVYQIKQKTSFILDTHREHSAADQRIHEPFAHDAGFRHGVEPRFRRCGGDGYSADHSGHLSREKTALYALAGVA